MPSIGAIVESSKELTELADGEDSASAAFGVLSSPNDGESGGDLGHAVSRPSATPEQGYPYPTSQTPVPATTHDYPAVDAPDSSRESLDGGEPPYAERAPDERRPSPTAQTPTPEGRPSGTVAHSGSGSTAPSPIPSARLPSATPRETEGLPTSLKADMGTQPDAMAGLTHREMQTDPAPETTDQETQTGTASGSPSDFFPLQNLGRGSPSHLREDPETRSAISGEFIEGRRNAPASRPAPAEAALHQTGDADPDAGFNNALKKYAANLAPENTPRLVAALKDRNVNTSGALDNLVNESKVRDMWRSLAFGAAGALGNTVNLFITQGIEKLAPNSFANRFPVGIFASAGVSTAVHSVAKSAGPIYHELPSVAAKPYLSPTELDSKTIVDDTPYTSLGNIDMFTLGALAVTGTEGWPATAAQMATGVVGFSAKGYNGLRNAEAIRTNGGKNQIQPWLDAADIGKTEKAIDDLQQPRIKALRGYAGNFKDLVRTRTGPAFSAVARSPRPLAYVAALAPSGIAGSLSRSAESPIAKLGWAVIDNTVHTLGLQQRLHIEHYMTGGISYVSSKLGLGEINWTHRGALAKAGLDSTGRGPAVVPGTDIERGPEGDRG
jgi:hypothetical protein